MIVPMKKIHVIVLKKDIVPALEILRDLGTVHVEHQEELSGYQLEERREEVNILHEAIHILKSERPKDPVEQKEVEDWTEIVNSVLELSMEIENYTESVIKRQAVMSQWELWGDFDPKDIDALGGRGIYLWFCEVPADKRIEAPEGVILETIDSSSGVDRCLAISREKVDLPFAVTAPPAMGLKEMERAQADEEKKIADAREKIKTNYSYVESLEGILVERKNVLRFEEVEQGMKEEESLALLKGFCPMDACADIARRAKEEQWGLLIEDPSDEDRIPTLLRNPRWLEMIKPVFNIINVLPGYREVDISPVFLIFFSLFFGMLIGDAGYGLMFLILTIFLQIKLRNKVKDQAPFMLVYVLSGAAVVWGGLTGTFFGTVLLGQAVKPWVAWLTESRNVQLFCFSVGFIHLAIAHLWRCIRKWPGLGAWAELGWVWVLLQAFLLARSMIILGASDMSVILKALQGMLPGVVLIVADIVKGPRDQISVGVVLLLFSIISAFTDIVSYVRLFAVGLAGVAVADAFNQMALSIGFNNVTAGIITSLILVVGHIFNIVLCGFGVLVHGLRLNVLEFSGHLGLEWAGFRYEPFKKLKQS
jgi:V/A-type H+-transporting ATPase subunit I